MKKLLALILMLCLFSACAEGLETVINDAVSGLTALSAEEAYVSALSTDSRITDEIAQYAMLKDMQPVNVFELNGLDALAANIPEGMSGTALRIFYQKLYSGSFIANYTAAHLSVYALAAASAVTYTDVYALDLPSGVYIAEYDNGRGVAVGIWNNGKGMNLVTASFVPSISALKALNFAAMQ